MNRRTSWVILIACAVGVALLGLFVGTFGKSVPSITATGELAQVTPLGQQAQVRAIGERARRETARGRDVRDGELQASTPPPPPRLAAIANDGSAISERLAALHQESPLTEAETTALLDFVAEESLPSRLSWGSYRHLVNDIWNVLAAADAPDLGRHLRRTAETTNDAVIRDYALQHLAHQFEHPSVNAIRTLEQATHDTSRPLAGTSLLGLRAIASAQPTGPDAAEINDFLRQQALAISTDPAAHKSSRVTALALCVDLLESGILPEARQIVSNPQAEPQLRIVAARALGVMGSQSDIQVLSRARATLNHPALFKAIDAAASQLSETSSGI